jgi:RNA polymerase sigma-70 factor (ECF subfamily)
LSVSVRILSLLTNGDRQSSRPFALVAVQIRDGQIAQIVAFLGPQHRFRELGLPGSLSNGELPLADR